MQYAGVALTSLCHRMAATQVSARLGGWAHDLLELDADAGGALLGPLAATLKRPLRPLWVSPRSHIIDDEHHGGSRAALAEVFPYVGRMTRTCARARTRARALGAHTDMCTC